MRYPDHIIALAILVSTCLGTGTALAVETKVIKLMTYNIKGLALRGYRHKERYRRITQAILELGVDGPDVIAFQEAMHSNAREILYQKLATTFPYQAEGPRRRSHRAHSGLVIFSKFPITDSSSEEFRSYDGYDSLARKGIQHVRIQVPGLHSKIDIFNTHLQAGANSNPGLTRAQVRRLRRAQLGQIQTFITHNTSPRNSVFLLGDFNIRFNQSRLLYRVITGVTLYNSINSVLRCTRSRQCEIEGSKRSWTSRIDHIFYREPRTNNTEIFPISVHELFKDETRGRVYSDHAALMTEFQINYEEEEAN